MFWVIKTVSIYLFSMPVSLDQWRGDTLSFSKISIFCLIVSLPYGCIFCRLPFLIISLILNRIMFFYFKECWNNRLTIRVYLFTTVYLLIISNVLGYLAVALRIISLKDDIEINPSHNSALNHMSSEFKLHISTYVYKSFPSMSIHFCPYYLLLRKYGNTWIQSCQRRSPIEQ